MTRLLADFGGTFTRFALCDKDERPHIQAHWLTSSYPSVAEAIDSFLEQHGTKERLKAVAVCAAGPKQEGAIALTNGQLRITENDIRQCTGVDPILLNDFAALALSLPRLASDDVMWLGGDRAKDNLMRAVLGPGTGLGVASLMSCADESFTVLSGEGGHVDLAPANERELSVIFQLMSEFGHVSAERVISGPGIETLFMSLCALDGVALSARPTVPDIIAKAHKGDETALEAIALFTGWLGALAGDVALTLGARGGVYIGGGVIARLGPLFRPTLFRQRFEAKGMMKGYLQPIPTWLITANDAALIGLNHAIDLQTRNGAHVSG